MSLLLRENVNLAGKMTLQHADELPMPCNKTSAFTAWED